MLTLALGLITLSAAERAAHAQLQVFVSPAKLEFPLPAGQADKRLITVANTGRTPIEINAYSSDWWYRSDAPKTFAPVGSFPRSSASWISLEDATFSLEPGESREYAITMTVPAGQRGGHYAVVFFEVRPAPESGAALDLRFGGRVGVLVAQFDPQRSKPALTIDAARVALPTASKPLAVDLDLTNPGDVHVKPQGSVTLIRGSDEYISSFPITAYPQILPGQSLTATAEWPSMLEPGDYTLLATVSYFGSKAVVKRFPLTVPKPTSSR